MHAANHAVRATGGNNASRTLVVQTYNTNMQHGLNFFTPPTDDLPRTDAVVLRTTGLLAGAAAGFATGTRRATGLAVSITGATSAACATTSSARAVTKVARQPAAMATT